LQKRCAPLFVIYDVDQKRCGALLSGASSYPDDRVVSTDQSTGYKVKWCHDHQPRTPRAGKLRDMASATLQSEARPSPADGDVRKSPMRVLFCSQNGYFPWEIGGLQSSTHELVRQLIALGHDCAVVSGFTRGRIRWYLARSRLFAQGKTFATHCFSGYDVYSARSAARIIPQVVAAFRPDVAVIQGRLTVPIARALKRRCVPAVIYIRDVDFGEQVESESLGDCADMFIANSEFTARSALKKFGIRSEIIVPSIDPAAYRVEPSREVVVFVNPVPKKGVAIALEVARLCPELPFLFVESWTLSNANLRQLGKQLELLPNVTLLRKTTDMRQIYGRAKIVLVPSVWDEAWGRVASEAQISGIPVVGSQRGGLPEAIGPGGIIIDLSEPAQRWADVLRQLWNDRQLYSHYSDAASKYAKRSELDPAQQAQTLVGILSSAIRISHQSRNFPVTTP
jgi:glycosyltransferase involved in cell wall biosynthesis